MILNLLAVGAGGAIGAIGRYLLTLATAQLTLHPTLGTIAANLFGSLLIGYAMGSAEGRMALFLSVGLCGGFTTFSTFSAQTVALIQSGQLLEAGVYAIASVALCVLATLLGLTLAN